MCAPCLANCGGAGCRLLICCLVAGCFACGAGEAVAVWPVALWLGVLRMGRVGLSPFSILPVGKSGARRGAGAVRSDIRVPEAKRGRVPL